MRTRVAFAANGGIPGALALVNRVMTESPKDRVWLFYGHQAGDGDLEELLTLKDRYLARLCLGVVTERDSDEAELLCGTLDAAKIRTLASSRLFDASRIDDYFVFGPDSLAADVRAALRALNIDDGRIHVEQPGNGTGHPATAGVATRAQREPAGQREAGAQHVTSGQRETQVSFVMDGRRRAFSIRTGEESIVDGAARAGIELPFSCKAGVCATCRTKLLRGEVEMAQNYALEDWELEQGFILACQSRAKTPEIELTYDEK
jgi:ring-1,2-phenylacetyl-CoA epoxidase subunit PaaE